MRLTGVWRPGDTMDGPASRIIDYTDVTYPDWELLIIATWDKTDPDVGQQDNNWLDTGYVWTRQYYDGLGRVVETQTRGPDWPPGGGSEEHDVAQHTIYNALGQGRNDTGSPTRSAPGSTSWTALVA